MVISMKLKKELAGGQLLIFHNAVTYILSAPSPAAFSCEKFIFFREFIAKTF